MAKKPRKIKTIYDKAKYHQETVNQLGLGEEHAAHHILFLLRWLIENNLMSELFKAEEKPLQEYLSGTRPLYSLFQWWDCCLADIMLSPEGNEFAMYYFGFDNPIYIGDYISTLKGKLPSEYYIEFTENNYRKLKPIIDRRYAKWKKPGSKWWCFWK